MCTCIPVRVRLSTNKSDLYLGCQDRKQLDFALTRDLSTTHSGHFLTALHGPLVTHKYTHTTLHTLFVLDPKVHTKNLVLSKRPNKTSAQKLARKFFLYTVQLLQVLVVCKPNYSLATFHSSRSSHYAVIGNLVLDRSQ